jgi:hypothetical protein
MLLNGGQLDGTRILSRTTIALMTSDHLGSRIAAPFGPGELLPGTPGYTFGLGFAAAGSPGDNLSVVHLKRLAFFFAPPSNSARQAGLR